MKITITISDAKARQWHYFLKWKYKSKANLETLVKHAMTEFIAVIAGEYLKIEGYNYEEKETL